MMIQEDNLIFPYDDKNDNDSIIESFLYLNQNYLNIPIYDKNKFFWLYDISILDLYEPDRIRLDLIENIKKELKFDVEKKNSIEIKINNNANSCDERNNSSNNNNNNNPNIELQLTDNLCKDISLAQKELIAGQNCSGIKNETIFKTVLHHKRGRKKN